MADLHKFAENARKGIANELERPLFVEKLCSAVDRKESIDGIHTDLFFPIVVDTCASAQEKGVWNSLSWNSVPDGSDMGWATKLGILIAEDRDLGVPAFVPDKRTNTSKYKKAIVNFVMLQQGVLDAKQQKWLKQNMVTTDTMDWDVYNDIRQVEQNTMKNGKKKNYIDQLFADDNNGNAAMDPLMMAVTALRANLLRQPAAGAIWGGCPLPGAAGLNNNDELVAEWAPPLDPLLLEDENAHRYRHHILDQDLFDPALPRVRLEEDLEGAGEEAMEVPVGQEGIYPPDEPLADGVVFERIIRDNCPKVYVTLTAVPVIDTGSSTYESRRLYVMRVSVVDPTIDVPAWLAKLNRYCQRQRIFISDSLNRSGGGRRQNFTFRFKYHDRVADTDHPAFNFTRERYIKCASFMNGDSRIRTKKQIEFDKALYDRNSQLHPTKVFSFENTARILLDHGGDPLFIGEKEDWLHTAGDQKNAIFPVNTPTFTYPSDTVFWCAPNEIGLMEQSFPQRSSHSELYSAMMHGENIDEILKLEQKRRQDYNKVMAHAKNRHDATIRLRQQGISTMLPQREDLNEVGDDGLSAIERDAVNRRVLHRHEIANARMLDYQTGNRMVHQAYEADAVYKNLAHLSVSNAAAVYTACQVYVEQYRNAWLDHLSSEDKAALHAAFKEGGTKVSAVDAGWAQFIPNVDQRKRILSTYHLHRDDWKRVVEKQEPELYKDVEKYQQYALAIQIVQAGCLERFSQLFRLDGRVDNLPISDSVKAVCKWFPKNIGPDRIITRSKPFRKKDPALTFFATDMCKYMTIYSRVARVVQPKVPLIAEGFLSCYDWKPGEINFHVLMHGRFDLGKTYQLLTILLKFSSIPGRVREESRSTFAAKDAGVHTYDATLAMDECPNWMTNSRAQENNAELVNQMKQRMTNKRSHLLSFERKVMPDGSTSRDTTKYVTDDTSCMACVTNNVVEKTAALTSRFFTIVMKDVGVSVLDTQFRVDSELKGNAKRYIQLNEFTSCAAKKAAMCGAILRDVNMDLWNDVSKRMIEYLEENNIIPKDSGYRPIQIMVPILRQFIYHRAALLTWYIPGAPHFNEPFELSHLQTLQRFLYVDLQTIIFVWTLLGSQYVDGNNSTVLSAAVKTAGVAHWGEGSSMYDVYVNKKRTAPRFRRVRNPDYEPPAAAAAKDVLSSVGSDDHNTADKYLLDLNYLTVEGNSLYNIYDAIASDTPSNNKIAANDIQGIIGLLSERQMQPPRNGYRRVPEGTFASKHAKHYNAAEETWTKKQFEFQDNETGDVRYHVYEEDDVPPIRPLNEKVQLPVVEIERPQRPNGKYKVHIAPWAIYRFQEEVIEQAFNFVVLTPHIPRKKMITGRTHPLDPSVFTCLDYTNEHYVSEYVRILAKEEKRPKGYTRYDGTVFVRHEVHTEAQLTMLDEELDGIDLKQLEEPLELITDLEYYSALQQHVCVGLPLDTLVDCPRTIEARYEAACALLNMENVTKRNIHYPKSFISQQQKKRKKIRTMVNCDVTKFDVDSMSLIQMLSAESHTSCNGFEDDNDEDEQRKRLREGKEEEDEQVGYRVQVEESLLDQDAGMARAPIVIEEQEHSSKRSRLDPAVSSSGKDILFDDFF